MNFALWKDRSKFRDKYINPFLDLGFLEMTQPDKPNSPKQKYFITIKGKEFLDYINTRL
jgi:ATP-dependent DNA helicase RecG